MQPPPSPESLNEPLYEAFYGLREQPFSLTTDPRFMYLSAGHRQAFDELLTGLRRREGLMLLTGDTGTGKTTLCRAVIDSLGHRTFSALILNPYMTDADVVRTILRDFGLVTRDDIRRGAFEHADMPQLLDTLETFLRSLVSLNSYAVVIIDEAQSLAPKVLDQIRVLGSIEQDGRRLLQIVLVGQPSLIEIVSGDSMRALADRISRRASIEALPAGDVGAYVQHRLTVAGGKDAVSFDGGAVARIADLSDGLPRRINLLGDRALELGRIAGVTTISAGLVSKAAKAIAGAKLPVLDVVPPPAGSPKIDVTELQDKVPTDGEPLSDDMFKGLDLTSPVEGFGEERELQLITEAPRRSIWSFVVMVAVLAAATAIAVYIAIDLGWLKL